MNTNAIANFVLGALLFSSAISSMECINCAGVGTVNRWETYYVDCVPHSKYETGPCTYCYGTGKKSEPWGGRFCEPEPPIAPSSVVPDYWSQTNFGIEAFPLSPQLSLWEELDSEFERNSANEVLSTTEPPLSFRDTAAACCSCFFPQYFKNHQD